MKKQQAAGMGVALGSIALIVWLWAGVFDTSARRQLASWHIKSLETKAKSNPNDIKHAAELIQRAQSSYGFEATIATAAIGEIGDAATPVIDDLAALMDSPNPYVRREAARSLAKLGPRSAKVLDKLVKQVSKVPSDDESWFAAEALGRIGAPAVEYLPVLKSRLGTGAGQFDDSLRRAIKELERIKLTASQPSTEAKMHAEDEFPENGNHRLRSD